MSKSIAALIAGAFAFGSVAAMAQIGSAGDKTPPQPVDTAKLKAERLDAKADAAKMTPEEKAAAKKAKRAKKEKELAAQESKAQPLPPATKAETEAIKATKSQPKALPNAAAKEKALAEQQKKASGQ